MTASADLVTLDRRGPIALLTVNNPPVNALSHGVRLGLRDGLRSAAGDASVQAVVVACAGRTFIAGADITEFGKPMKDPSLHEVLDAIDGALDSAMVVINNMERYNGWTDLDMVVDKNNNLHIIAEFPQNNAHIRFSPGI